MENQSPCGNPVLNDPCSRQGNILREGFFQASFPKWPLGFYTQIFLHCREEGLGGGLLPGVSMISIQLSSCLGIRDISKCVHSSFSPHPTKAMLGSGKRDPWGDMNPRESMSLEMIWLHLLMYRWGRFRPRSSRIMVKKDVAPGLPMPTRDFCRTLADLLAMDCLLFSRPRFSQRLDCY